MAIIVGSARIDERGKLSGGAVGDQIGKEVSTQSFYMHSKGWYRIRPKSEDDAKKIAAAMKQACGNNHIGYDQSNRTDVVKQVKKYGSFNKISVNTECDCSSLVRACVWQATGKDVGDFYTGNEASVLEKSGLFEKRVLVTSSADVRNGDVLVTKTKGHTVIVVSGAPRSKTTATKPVASTSKRSGYMFEPTQVYKGCAKSTSVLLLQEILRARGFKGKDKKLLTLDWECGDNTEYAINAYQAARRAQGVELGTNGKNDGCCGKKMWKDLIAI